MSLLWPCLAGGVFLFLSQFSFFFNFPSSHDGPVRAKQVVRVCVWCSRVRYSVYGDYVCRTQCTVYGPSFFRR